MEQEKIDILSRLFREMEAEMGTRDLSILVLKALITAVDSLDAESAEQFCTQFRALTESISRTEPKFGILNYHFAKLTLELQKDVGCCSMDNKKWKHIAKKKVKKILKDSQQSKVKVITEAEKVNVEGKTILIHDHSHTVQDVLVNLKKKGHHFKVVIAEQDFEKSHDNIERMHAAKIDFQVVPAYMLSHIHKDIDMLFFGALTLKDSMDFVMDPGTHSIISEFHLEKIPAYMFISTAKFSLWKSKKRGEVFIREYTKKHHAKPIEYTKIKYSHDRVPAKLFEKIVTNEGIFTPDGLKKLYLKKFEKYKALE